MLKLFPRKLRTELFLKYFPLRKIFWPSKCIEISCTTTFLEKQKLSFQSPKSFIKVIETINYIGQHKIYTNLFSCYKNVVANICIHYQ